MINETEQQGWIKLYRKILNWEWYSDTPTRSVFIDLLLHASHNEYKWKGQTILRGQVIFGRKETAKRLGLSEQSVRTAINHLKSTNEITIKTTNKYSLITLAGYEKFQSPEQETTSKSTSKLTINQPSTNHQLTTTKNVKKIKNEKNIYIHELPEILNFYNEVFQTNLTSTKGFEANYGYWRETHDIETIKTAIENARKDKFWHDKMTLAILFRKKNQRGENVDWIQDLAGRVTQNQGNIAII